MKASLPFKYIIAVKGGKQYVVFDFKDDNDNRKRKWVCTGLPEHCTQKALNAKTNEIVSQFCEEYYSGKATKVKQKRQKKNFDCTDGTYSFTKFLKIWLDAIKPTIAETTYESYLCKVNSVIAYFDSYFPDIALAEVTAMELQRFYNDQYKAGVSANTIKHYHANIHSALQYAVKMNLVTVNESEKTERPKLEKYEATFYNEKELAQLFEVFKNDRMELVVLIAAYYGLRRSEIIGLRWDAIDFEKKTITIREKAYNGYENGKRVVKFQNQLKTKSSFRTLPLIPYIADLLRKKQVQNEYFSQAIGWEYNHDYDEFICTDQFGNLITPCFVTDHFRTVVKKNKLRKLRFHDLRHSCASLLLANGVSMKEIQEWLGHSTFNVTADFYSHLDYSSKISSAETIADVLNFGNADADEPENKDSKK